MYKHILLPTDGSDLSKQAIAKAVAFGKSLGARITGLFAAPQFQLTVYDDWIVEPMSQLEFEEKVKQQAQQHLAVIEKAAAEAGAPCEVLHVINDSPYDAIIKTAEEKGCDLIFMASHGRQGIKSLLLGSETMKVLTHTKIAVLVYR